MTAADNVTRLDDAMTERHQPIPINKAALHAEVRKRRDDVLDRLAVVRVSKQKNEAQIAALQEDIAQLNEEAHELELLADAMLTEMHAFDRMMQGR